MHDLSNDEELLKTSLEDLEAILSQKETFPSYDKDQQLIGACLIVARSLGVEVPISQIPPNSSLATICRLSNLRSREIRLPANWWQKNHGSFIGFIEKKPVALLFSKKGKYELIDPKTKKRIAVNEAVGSKILPDAVVFYSLFPLKYTTFLNSIKHFFYKGFNDYLSLGFIGILITLIGVSFPVANKLLFDYVIPDYSYTGFVQVIIGLFVAVLSSSIFLFAQSYIALRIDATIGNRIQVGLWDRILKLPTSFFRTMELGDLAQRTFLFEEIRKTMSQQAISLVFNGFLSFLYFFVMLFYSWELMIVVLTVVTIGFFVFTPMFLRIIYYQRITMNADGKINAFLIRAIQGIQKLRTAAAEHRVFVQWTKAYSFSQMNQLKSKYLQNVINASNHTIGVILTILIFGTVIWIKMFSHTPLTVGTYLAFIAAFSAFSTGFFSLISTVLSMVNLIPLWQRANPLLSTPLEISPEMLAIGPLKGAIEAEHLFFRYAKNTDFQINDLSLSINAGQFVGIVGPSGCGKSTLCRLLIGFETLGSGRIAYDNKDIEKINLQDLRTSVSAILSKKSIFSGTMYDNITCGEKYSAAEIQKALQLSTFDKDLVRFPLGIQTLLLTGSDLLSGGEKQKLLLTRALIRNPKILILDESLNYLDNISQEEILDNLLELKVTIVLCTHHPVNLRRADRIYYMEKGSIKATKI